MAHARSEAHAGAEAAGLTCGIVNQSEQYRRKAPRIIVFTTTPQAGVEGIRLAGIDGIVDRIQPFDAEPEPALPSEVESEMHAEPARAGIG